MKPVRLFALSALVLAVAMITAPSWAQDQNQQQDSPTKKKDTTGTTGSTDSGTTQDKSNPPADNSFDINDVLGKQKDAGHKPRNTDAPTEFGLGRVTFIGATGAPVTGYKPVLFESGPFEGLESFGYSYFAAARQAVKSKSGPQSQALIDAPTNPNASPTVNGLANSVGPNQMTFSNINTPAPDRYQLGPGDKLTVRFWSPTEEAVEKIVVVDAAGSISIPVMGSKLTVRGMTLAQAQTAIEKEIRRGLKDAQVTVNLSELRSISVSIVGEVTAQGNYQFPSVMTLFNALYAAGGPTINGSMRNIQLRRSNGKAITVDLYSYLLKGDASQDVPLQPGDLILVPIATQRVAVKGEVGRPAVYETTSSDSLKDVISYAGGAKSTAVVDQIEVASTEPGVSRRIINVNMAEAASAKLKTDDIITLYPVRGEFQNTIEVEGAVDQPRKYQLAPGMTVADAVRGARGLLSDAFTARADLYRENSDKSLKLVPIDLSKALGGDSEANVPLQNHDRLHIYFQKEVSWLDNRMVTLRGAVRNPGKYVRMDGMRIRDLLLQGGGLQPDASYDTLFVNRKNPDGSEGPLLQLDVRKVLQGGDDNVALNDLDLVTVFSVSDAKFTPEHTVSINGAVQHQGNFPRAENLMLTDLIKLAGGLMPSVGTTVQVSHSRVPENTKIETYQIADLAKGAVDIALRDGDVVTIPYRGDYQEAPLLVELRGRVAKPGVYAVNSRSETIANLIKEAGGLTTDAWAEGAQFLRDPKNLQSDAEAKLSPRIRRVFDVIHEAQYVRALAKSDLDKIRILNSQGNQALNGLSILSGLGSTATQLPASGADMEAAKKLVQNRELVSPARELNNEELLESGNIPIRLDIALNQPTSPNNIVLKDGDIIVIPEKPTTVAVRGAVFVPSTILYDGSHDLQYYLDRCGGPTIDADKEEIIIIRASGSITKAKGKTRIELGDTIFVPTRVMVAQLSDGQTKVDSIFKQVTNIGFLYVILRNLIK
ncbi:MAG: hypothetical protein GC165_05830 [Armatimonadetes bacterium]|nr:hypothetical protein [Armatimonadota bacterium]